MKSYIYSMTTVGKTAFANLSLVALILGVLLCWQRYDLPMSDAVYVGLHGALFVLFFPVALRSFAELFEPSGPESVAKIALLVVCNAYLWGVTRSLWRRYRRQRNGTVRHRTGRLTRK